MQKSSENTLTIIDLRKSDDEIRKQAMRALQNTVTPMFAVENFGFETWIERVTREAHSRYDLDEFASNVARSEAEADSNIHVLHAVEGMSHEPSPAELELHKHMKALANRLARVLLGEAYMRRIEENGRKVDGRLSLRFYPDREKKDSSFCPQLGSHVDGNLFTILHSDQRGIEVLDPSLDIPPEAILSHGMPMIGEAKEFEITSDHFVDPFAECSRPIADYLLVTVGNSFLRLRDEEEAAAKPLCGVLHRVNYEAKTRGMHRHSIPYLVDIF